MQYWMKMRVETAMEAPFSFRLRDGAAYHIYCHSLYPSGVQFLELQHCDNG